MEECDTTSKGVYQLGTRFSKFKGEIISLRMTCEKHFNECMKQIRDGLPDVKQSKKDDRDPINYVFTKDQQ